MIALALAAAFSIAIVFARWPAYLALAVFPLFWAAFLGLLQAREKT